MSRKNYDVVTFERFVDRYLDSPSDAFAFQKGAGQIYPLSLAVARIKPPDPPFSRPSTAFCFFFWRAGASSRWTMKRWR